MYCIKPFIMYGKMQDKAYYEGQLLPFKPKLGDKFKGEVIYDWEAYKPLPVPCGHCISCQHNRKLQLSLVMLMELMTHQKQSCFLTLTYNEDHRPQFGLNNLHLSLFFKSLKQFLRREYPGLDKIKYLTSSEYGTTTYRPHYHAVIFGFNPYDFTKITFEYLKALKKPFDCPLISRFWTKGYNYTMPCNKAMCFYTAGYTEKKLVRTTQDYLDKVTISTRYRKQHSDFPRLITISSNKFYTPDQLEFIKAYNKDIINKYAFVNKDTDKEYNPDFCHGRCIKFKNKPYMPAERVYPSNGLGDEYFKRYYEDFYLGYVVDPMGSGVKYKIPNKFLLKLKEINPEWYDNYKASALVYIKEKSEFQKVKDEAKFHNICVNDLSSRILDYEPLSSTETLEFEELC